MPAMPQPKGLARNIADTVLGKKKRKKRLSKKEHYLQERLVAQETSRVK